MVFGVDLLVLGRQYLERGFDDAAAQAEHEMEGRLFLDVVVAQRAPILQLLAGENQSKNETIISASGDE
jgi:hypothetical protein